MKIYYYKHPLGNVGDDLNSWLWQKLMPDLFQGYRYHGDGNENESDAEPIFIGIGTLLDEQVPFQCQKVVFGTGAGYGTPVFHSNAKYYAVRGPLTAMKLNLNANVSVTDGAALIATLKIPSMVVKHKFSVIPHHANIEETSRWRIIAERLNINFIDPSKKPDDVISEILSSELILAEAMHGAILADTLRVPWIPYMSTLGRHEFKWEDWCASLNLRYEPCRLYPLYRTIGIRTEINNYVKQEINSHRIKNMIRFKKLYLSKLVIFEEKLEILLARLEEFKHDFAVGYFSKK